MKSGDIIIDKCYPRGWTIDCISFENPDYVIDGDKKHVACMSANRLTFKAERLFPIRNVQDQIYNGKMTMIRNKG